MPSGPPLKCLLQSAEIKCDHFKFLILMMPTNTSIPFFIEELQKHNCSCVVRVCESKYSIEPFKEANIEVKDLPYQDGTAPSPAVVNEWVEFLHDKLVALPSDSPGGGGGDGGPVCVAIHCVAGLGRAPVLVAVALLEYGMKSLEVVELIRARRRGAINQTQLDYLTSYKSKKRLKPKKKRSKVVTCSFF
jgi:protein tyrosine phosphatase type 4A